VNKGTLIRRAHRGALPGGVDNHCHVEQLEADGGIHEETFEMAGISAIAGSDHITAN
jgi:hypothetical protein